MGNWKYKCPSCTFIDKWGKVRDHMVNCCPPTVPAELKTLKACLTEESKREREQKKQKRQQKNAKAKAAKKAAKSSGAGSSAGTRFSSRIASSINSALSRTVGPALTTREEVQCKIIHLVQGCGDQGIDLSRLPLLYTGTFGSNLSTDIHAAVTVGGQFGTVNVMDFLQGYMSSSVVLRRKPPRDTYWVFLKSRDEVEPVYPAVAVALFGKDILLALTQPSVAASPWGSAESASAWMATNGSVSNKRTSNVTTSTPRRGSAPSKRVKLAVEDTTANMVTFDQALNGISRSRSSGLGLGLGLGVGVCGVSGAQGGSANMEAQASGLASVYPAVNDTLFGAAASAGDDSEMNMEEDADPMPRITTDDAHRCLQSYFGRRPVAGSGANPFDAGLSLSNRSHAAHWEERALLGHLTVLPEPPTNGYVIDGVGAPYENKYDNSDDDGSVYMNVHEPFCFAAVGVQGAGKSHTLSCVLESCLVSFQVGETDVVKLKKPMTSLVLHYDQNTTSLCESAGLLVPNPDLNRLRGFLGQQEGTVPCVSQSKAVVLVSPTFYRQRKAFYGDYCQVKPLLFQWKTLTADHIKRIMRIQEKDNQLYVASFMTLLRSYQRQAVVPDFDDFMKQVKRVCNVRGQQGPLDQRIALLESMVAESDLNKDLRYESLDLSACVAGEYSLIITDLTDPLLSKEEANGLFQVLTEQFRSLPVSGGKLLCLDECHKYMDGVKSDGLSEAIVDVARLMRHDGVRLAVSTQSPLALAPELLELVSVAVLHHFHSMDWWTYLQKKLSLHDAAWEHILALRPGNALAFATRHNLTTKNSEGSHILPIHVRPRITADLGISRRNV